MAKTKIQKILDEKFLSEDDVMFVYKIMHCDTGRISYKVILKNDSFIIFDDGTELR